jgi:predicted membrane chloride channel (bestrophin family)
MFSSGTVRGLLAEIGTVFVVSILVWTFNFMIIQGALSGFGISGGDTKSLISLPVLPFQISSPALGLLLVFRTNTVYSRWNAGRLAFEHISYHAVDLARQGMAYLENVKEKEELARRVIALLYAVKKVFRPAEHEVKRIRDKMEKVVGSSEAERILSQKKGYLQGIQDLTRIIRRSKTIDGSTKARYET